MRSVINCPTWVLIIYLVFVARLHAQPIPDYFPTHIGDKWTYKLTSNLTTHVANKIVEITDTTTILQEKYFVFEEKIYDIYYEPGKVYRSTHYYRKTDNGNVKKYSVLINQEQLYYTFQKDSLYHPYWYYGDYNSVDKLKIALTDTDAVIRIPSGVFADCYVYSFGLFFGDIGGRLTKFLSLTPGIGLIIETVEGDFNFITGAYINGQLMGDTTVTAVQKTEQSELPRNPILYQNYPNPFNNTTRIAYSIPDFWTEPVQISIFDISGREIVTFTQTDLTKGHRRILWNGVNKLGKEVSGGIYIARLKSGRFSQDIKINYLRYGGEMGKNR